MKILWVHTHAPWSEWTNSGASRAICLELRRRGLLHAALGPDFVSRTYAADPGLGFKSLLRIQARWPWLLPSAQRWDSEDDGELGQWISRLPEGSPVVYVFDMPRPSKRKNLKRYLFLNLSAYDARRTGSFAFDELSDEDFESCLLHQREMLEWADGLVTPSTYAADSIARDFGYPREKITSFGYGAGMALGHIQAPTVGRFSKRNILFVGRDWERKGGPLVHAAWQQVRKEIPDVTLSIVGPQTAPVSGPGVRFVGYLDKTTEGGKEAMLREYASASVFCMPTHCEPWGLVFTEAAAMGTPIVSFREWSLPDIVQDGVTGRLVDRHDAEALAAGLLDVLSDPQRALSMAHAAFQRSHETLSWPRAVDRLLVRIMPIALGGQTPRLMQDHGSVDPVSG